MSSRPRYLEWLEDTGRSLKTADGKNVKIWRFKHLPETAILSEWARHFRQHYCLDEHLDILRATRSRSEYLLEIKFPSATSTLGPPVRAGDFGEILVADFFEWVFGHWVPRVRWGSKVVRDESSKGSDVVGFKCKTPSKRWRKDEMAIVEVKTKLSVSGANRLQDAVDDSAKDQLRIDESLNFIKQKMLERNDTGKVLIVERFQSPVDYPYVRKFGAVAIISEEVFDEQSVLITNTRKCKGREHPFRSDLELFVICGAKMMQLVHSLYQRAADEA